MTIIRTLILFSTLAIAGCSQSQGFEMPDLRHFFEKPEPPAKQTMVAWQYLDYGEASHRQELKALTGVDPVRTEWCAAFINAVLRESGIEGSERVSDYPLTARSFLSWGISVEEPMLGDIVVFPRGNAAWQGHVGFYFGSINIDGKEYYKILGGNQDNKVSIELYRADYAISIRRESTV